MAGFDSTLSTDEQARALRTTAGARLLDDRVLRLRGADRLDWLAGIVTQDVKSLRPGESRYTAIVHEKGKILADGFVHVRAEDVWLILPAASVEAVREHFERHIIMEDVECEPIADVCVVAVQGPMAAERFAPDGKSIFLADRIGWGGVDVILPTTEMGTIATAIDAGRVVAVGEEAWETARLEAGIPRFGVDFGNENYVQEANITARAVSFQKGCYVGQEVVCRLEMRGHVRRQLATLRIDGPPPAHGTPVDSLGEITSARASSAVGASVAIAMLKWGAAPAGTVLTVGTAPASVVDRPLPR